MAISQTGHIQPYKTYTLPSVTAQAQVQAQVYTHESAVHRIYTYACKLLQHVRTIISKTLHTYKPLPTHGGTYGISHSLKNQAQTPYCILSVDGGGVRGVIPLTVLSLIEQEVGVEVVKLFDCMAGTSTGGIIVAGLSVPNPAKPQETRYSSQDLLQLYYTFAEKVFVSTIYQRISSIWGAFAPKYPSPRALLENLIGDSKVSDLLAKKAIITSYAYPQKVTVLFDSNSNNSKATLQNKNISVITPPKDISILDALTATSAAPTYFESVVVDGINYIDGGVAVNNPAQVATLLSLYGGPIFVLSLGTGVGPADPVSPAQPLSKGYVWWAERLIGLQIDAQSKIACEQLQTLSEKDPNIVFFRFQVELESEEEAQLDNATQDNLRHLQDLATRAWNDCKKNNGGDKVLAILKNKVAALKLKKTI